MLETIHEPNCACDIYGGYNDPRCEAKWESEVAETDFYPCGHQKTAGGIKQHDCKD